MKGASASSSPARVFWGVSGLLAALCLCTALTGACKPKVTREQCDQLVDRFAGMVVREHFAKVPDAGTPSPEVIRDEQERERNEARNDENFRNCTSEISAEDFRCAMAATTAEAFLHCLE